MLKDAGHDAQIVAAIFSDRDPHGRSIVVRRTEVSMDLNQMRAAVSGAILEARSMSRDQLKRRLDDALRTLHRLDRARAIAPAIALEPGFTLGERTLRAKMVGYRKVLYAPSGPAKPSSGVFGKTYGRRAVG